MSDIQRQVAVVRADTAVYPVTPPFHPSANYPEIAQLTGIAYVEKENHVYESVRTALALLGLDRARWGTAQWNPLGDGIIRPGDHVLVKPNWVLEGRPDDGSWEQIITHGSVLRAVIDYVALALSGTGRITLADGPMLSSNFHEICDRTGIPQLIDHYRRAVPGLELEVIDLRSLSFTTKDEVILRRTPLAGDPRGAVRVNLGRQSEFFGFRGEGRYYGADYDTKEVNAHHKGEIQEYLLSGTALSANVIIDVPKLKTHQKAGMTLCLKGVVGLNSGRNWLPHRTQGTPLEGGDQYQASTLVQRIEGRIVRAFEASSLVAPTIVSPLHRVAKRLGKRIFGTTDMTVRGGGWYGNDTLWRMVLDINRALTFADADGLLHQTPVRTRFCIVDGIVAGEAEGPIYAKPVRCGAIIAGANPVRVDVTASELVGFDFARIPTMANAIKPHPLPLLAGQISETILVDAESTSTRPSPVTGRFKFLPPKGWAGHIEYAHRDK